MSKLHEIERLIRATVSVDQSRTRRIREMFLNLLPLISDADKAQEVIAPFVSAHTNFEVVIAQDCEPKLIEAKRRDCLVALAQVEREIEFRKAN